jgi:hypothetical protein
MIEMLLNVSVLMYVLGVLTRMVLPWLIKIVAQLKSENPEPIQWQWRYLAGTGLTAVVVLLVTPLLIEDVTVILESSPFAAWSIGYAIAAIGRELDKLVTSFAKG